MPNPFPPHQPGEPFTMRHAFEEKYVPYLGTASPYTISKYRDHLWRWEEFTPNPDVREVTDTVFRDFRNKLIAQGLANITVNSYISTLLAIFRHLGPRDSQYPHALGVIEQVPWPGKPLRVDSEPAEPASLDALAECYRFSDFARWPQPDPGAWWRAWFMVAYNTGLRRGDLLTLNWSMLNDAQDCITLRTSKANRIQRLPILPVVLAHLQALPRESERIFHIGVTKPHRRPRNESRPGTRWWSRFGDELRVIAAAARVEAPLPQMIRRAAAEAFEFAHNGCGSALLGHRDVTGKSYVSNFKTLSRAAQTIPQFADETLQCTIHARPFSDIESERWLATIDANEEFATSLAEKLAGKLRVVLGL